MILELEAMLEGPVVKGAISPWQEAMLVRRGYAVRLRRLVAITDAGRAFLDRARPEALVSDEWEGAERLCLKVSKERGGQDHRAVRERLAQAAAEGRIEARRYNSSGTQYRRLAP